MYCILSIRIYSLFWLVTKLSLCNYLRSLEFLRICERYSAFLRVYLSLYSFIGSESMTTQYVFQTASKCNDAIMPHTSKWQLDLNCDLTRDLTWLDSTWLESPPKIEWLDLTRVTFENRLTWLDSSQNVQWLEMTRDSKVVTWSQHCQDGTARNKVNEQWTCNRTRNVAPP